MNITKRDKWMCDSLIHRSGSRKDDEMEGKGKRVRFMLARIELTGTDYLYCYQLQYKIKLTGIWNLILTDVQQKVAIIK